MQKSKLQAVGIYLEAKEGEGIWEKIVQKIAKKSN